MKLALRSATNLMTSDQEPGSFFNLGEHPVLQRVPSLEELHQLWEQFDHEFRSALKELFLQPYGEVVETLGRLGFRSAEQETRKNTLYGMLTTGKPAKSSHFRKVAMADAAMELDLLSDRTPHGKKRKRVRRGEGSIEEYALSIPIKNQRDLINAIVNLDDVDHWLAVSQGSAIGWSELRTSLLVASDSASFLNTLAGQVDRLLGNREALIKRHGTDGKIVFAPSWFGQFLARRGIWIWPARYVSRIAFLYPQRLTPLVTRLSVDAPYRSLADKVFRYHQDQRLTGAAVSMQVFAMLALAGNTWSDADSGFRWYPLASFKSAGGEYAAFVTSSINAVYKIAVEHFGHELMLRPEAKLFLYGVRLKQTGVDAFHWTSRPTAFNTQVASRLLKRPVTQIPDHVRSWAAQLRELLPLFQVKAIDQIEGVLNLWLIFMMTLEAADAPVDFQSISRIDHIHDIRGKNQHTFRVFLKTFFDDGNSRDLGNRALSALQKAFYFASVRDGFQQMSNPVELKLDRIGRSRIKRADVTPRKPLEMEAWELIVRKNRADNYAFARGLGRKRYHQTLLNPNTGEYDHVFWPAEAIVVDVILNSGMRHVSGRWIDSGEGDEQSLDITNMRMIPNDHPTATLGRKEGFLQLVDIPSKETRLVIGMNVGLNKTGASFVIPWTDPDIIKGVQWMRDLQSKYNPITAPVKPMEGGSRDVTRTSPELFPDIYPLFRDPGSPLNMAVSANKVLTYWKELLHACQPAVNELFGHEYPLIDDDGMVFDLHALRVTMVSNLLEAGVSLEIVRDLVGHATWIMTWHYNGRRSAMLHSAVQETMAKRMQALDRLAAGDRGAIDEFANDAITPDFVRDHVGSEMLRGYAARKNLSPFEVFAHGICPGGLCATGGERISEGKYKPGWRERACSGCRYRVTGPQFLPGILNRLNNLMAEIRLSAKRAKELGNKIEDIEAREGKTAHALRRSQQAESGFRNQLTKEYALETKVLEMVRQVAMMAAEKAASADRILVPSVPDFHIENLEYGFAETHEFELLHMLVKETYILPASIMEIPHGVEENMKAVIREILHANDMSELAYRLPVTQGTDANIRIGDILLREFPEPTHFQQLIEGAVRLNVDALDNLRDEINLIIAQEGSARPQIGRQAS